jgi:hypothetical protein
VKACYRELHRYKYQLTDDYEIKIDIKLEKDIVFEYLSLSSEGLLWIKKHYAWDGPSGPTIDTRDFMRGSLVHDALYQMMRLRALDNVKYRKRADELLRDICREDGMWAFRAWYVYLAVRIGASGSAKPGTEPEVKIICVP